MAHVSGTESFPRQRARTRGFRLGVPRAFAIAPDGSRIAFLRSPSGYDPRMDLWVLDCPGEAGAEQVSDAERRVVCAEHLLTHTADELPPAEAARRERMRETSEGITAFATDTAVRIAAFALAGTPYAVNLDDPRAEPVALPAPGAAIDPRPDPAGTRVGFVSDGGLHVVNLATREITTLAQRPSDASTWGLADFIAAEEFSRMRGWWWLADGSGIIASLVDEAPVDTWWISDPAQPQNPPREHRYPAAGHPNAHVSLWIFDLFGNRTQIDWDHEAFPYLTSVHVSPEAHPVIAVLSRDQREQLVVSADPRDGSTTVIATRQDAAWIDIIPGVPRPDSRGALLEVVRDIELDCNRLCRDGQPITPEGFNVRTVIDVDGDRVLITGSTDPMDEIPAIIDHDGLQPLFADGIGSARISGDLCVVTRSGPDNSGVVSTVRRGLVGGKEFAIIESHAATPVVFPQPYFQRSGGSLLPTAILWPTGHVPGSQKLPVLLAPYGGPHSRRVLRTHAAYASDQWWADQGFCVVIADGRGTPGRGPSWERAVLHDLATPVLDDQIMALDAVLAEFPQDTDPERVGIHGWSFGGYLAALALLRRGDRVHAGVAGAPVTDWRLYDTAYTERYLKDPRTHGADYDACSLILQAHQLTRPLLLIHGLADDNVVAAHTLRLSSALLAAGRDHGVLPLSGVTHMTPQEIVAENLLLAQRSFFNEHLK